MRNLQRTLNLICVVCIIAINASFVVQSSRGTPMPFVVRFLPVAASNLLFLAMFLSMRTIIRRRRQQYEHLERRFQSLQMISEDREAEGRILETLSDVSVEFMEKMELGPLLGRVSQAIHEILRVDISIIEVFPESGDEAMRFLRGAEGLAFSEEFYRDTIYLGKSLLMNKLSNDPQYESLTSQGIESIIVAPLRLHGRTIGMIGACTKQQRGFTSRDLRQLYIFACHAALLVETTQLLRSVRRISVKDDSGDLRHLKERLHYDRQLREREMEVARGIQMGLLPRSLPRIEHVAIEGESQPAKEVGGDYYDVLELGDGRWGIAIADVSGKGVPAALVMVMTRTLLHALARTSRSPAAVLTAINADLYKETDPSVFVSMLYGIWDANSRTFIYANAGHEPPILTQRGALMSLPSGGVALGVVENAADVLDDTPLRLGENDSLFLFTDGATEARNEQGAMFGIERLAEAIKGVQGSGRGAVRTVLESIKQFAGNADQHDDITVVCVTGSDE